MKTYLVLSLILTCGLATAIEKPAAEKSATETLLDVTNYEETSIEAAVSAFDGMMAQLKQQNVPSAAIDEIRAEARALFSGIFTNPEMRKKTGELYDKHFSEGEIIELTEFYRTPLGQKTLAAMPSIMQEAIAQAMPALQEAMGGFQKKVGEIIEKHQKAADPNE
jgi:uncharacterized protein